MPFLIVFTGISGFFILSASGDTLPLHSSVKCAVSANSLVGTLSPCVSHSLQRHTWAQTWTELVTFIQHLKTQSLLGVEADGGQRQNVSPTQVNRDEIQRNRAKKGVFI